MPDLSSLPSSSDTHQTIDDLPSGGSVYVAEPLPPSVAASISARSCWQGVCFAVHWLFGLLSLVVVLSILATIPVLQFMSLGYLLEATARVVRAKRIRAGFIGISQAAQVGSIGLGIFLSLLPIRVVSSLWYSSLLLNGETAGTHRLRWLTWALCFLVAGHIGWAVYRGGKLRHFFWPAPLRLLQRRRQGGMYREGSENLHSFFLQLKLPHFFWLGFRGFLGASIWLFVPVTMMALSTKADDLGFGGLLAFLGGITLAIVLLYLPFLQSQLAITNRFGSQFAVRKVRAQFQRAPIAYWFSILVTLTLAIPLYLLKAELIPREAAWLPSLFFVAFMYPARLGVGWAIARSEKRPAPRLWVSRWLARFALLPVTLTYALIVYFTQFTSWYGSLSLYEQHAFLVPVPFLGY